MALGPGDNRTFRNGILVTGPSGSGALCGRGHVAGAVQHGDLTPWAAPTRGSVQWRKIEIPSANGHGNALAVARLYQIYATGGMIGSAQVLSRDAFSALTRPRWKGDDLVLPFNIDWRTGVMGNSNRVFGPTPEAIGHPGSGGSVGFGDPVTGISVGYVMNKQSHYIMGDPRSLRLIEAVYACL